MHIKKGDNVIVVAGKDRGKTGKVVRAFPSESRVLVEGVNVKQKHQRPRRSNQQGQIVEKTHPVHISNVMLVDTKSGKGTRIRHEMKGNKKVRVAVKTNNTI